MTKPIFMSRFCQISLAALAAGLQVNAAVAAPTAAGSGNSNQIEEIVVTGIRASLERSLEIKKSASGVVDAITAEDIGKFPDLNLSESLQRIPGVTLNRNANGEGQAINLRGLGPQFTRVELNGMSGLGNGTGGRFGVSQSGRAFNFEILASELFSKAEVHKTISADQTEGGLAGVVQLNTPKPFDYKGFKATASALGSSSENTGKTDPRLFALVSNNWDGRFGLTGSIAYSKTNFATDTAEGGSWRAFASSNTGTRAPDDVRSALVANGSRYYHFEEEREVFNAAGAAQWRPSDQLELTLDGILAKQSGSSMALRDDQAIEGGANNPNSTTIKNGVITAGDFTGIQQRVGHNFYTTEEKLGQLVASANWEPGNGWTLTPSVGYSQRKTDRTWDLYSFRLADSTGKFDPGVVSYKTRGDFVDFSSTANDFTSNPQNFLFNVFVFRPTKDKSTEFQAKFDIVKTFDSALQKIRFGVRYADDIKNRSGTQDRLNVSKGVANAAVPNLSSVFALYDYSVDGGSGPSRILGVRSGAVRGVFLPNGAPVAGTSLLNYSGYGAQNSYRIQEKTINGYASAEFGTDNVQVITGLRLLRTQQISSGYTVANINLPTQSITPISVRKAYTNFLPSLTAKWTARPDLIVRLGYSRTLTRPDLDSLAPSETVAGIDASGGTGAKGNPNLNPYLSDNIDLGSEYYFGKDGVISANLFTKKMDGFIDTKSFVEPRTYPRQADGVLVTGPITFSQPTNSVSADVQGLELAAQTQFDFLPGIWSNLGALANLTLTKSSANFATANDVRSSGLPGLSKSSWNATLYYSDPKLDVRLSYAWRSRYLAAFADDFGVPRFVNEFGQLDFSSSYNLNRQVSIQVQGLNLLKTQEVDVSSAKYLPYGVNELDRRILVGVRMTY